MVHFKSSRLILQIEYHKVISFWLTSILYFQLKNKFTTIVKTVISFFEVDYTFDRSFLIKNINDCRGLLKQLVGNHLTDKSLGRIDHVLDFFTDATFLEEMFRKSSPYRPALKSIIDDMNKAFDEGGIWTWTDLQGGLAECIGWWMRARPYWNAKHVWKECIDKGKEGRV